MRPSHRVSGQRRYGVAAVHRLAVVRRAREAGFSLADIRELFFGFEASVPVPARWKKLAARKRLDLDEKIEKLQAMKALLSKLEERCGCETVEQCGVGILRAGFGR
jgi:DNA-binding transcriptional MerR regulator